MKSFAILRTNVGLTTNVKLVVGSSYDLYVDSIVSTAELSSNRYKKVQINKDTTWDNVLPVFFKNTPTDISYKIKYDNDVDKMSTDFANQYDDIYQYGARNIVDNKFYSEEFEYFAPLYINKYSMPNNFIIFRVDGPGLLTVNKDNFRNEILKKLKCVKNFDLTPKTYLGQWINNNFKQNKSYPNRSLYIDFRRMEFSSWLGIDYERGGYAERNYLLDTTFEFEQPFFDMEKLVMDGYRNSKIIFPNIVNFSFLFDDTPATKSSLRKWSLNRYLGFYIDELTLVRKFSPNKLPSLKPDVRISSNNELYSMSSDSPFLNEWEVEDYPYIEIDNKYYKIEQFRELSSNVLQKIQNTEFTFEERVDITTVIKYKVISEISLSGKTFSDMNRNLITIDSDNFINFQDGTPFSLPDFDSSDVWLIEIGDRLHNIVIEDGKYKIHTDWAFEQSRERFEYFINNKDPQYFKSINLLTSKDISPSEFNIYRCKFTDIKDFDTDIIDTDFAKFEYIKRDSISETDESKFYVRDLESENQPKDYVKFQFQNRIISIPTPSEYTANNETFRIKDGTLSELWRKNALRVKWGFDGSISSQDYPYLLNNSILSGDYNKSPNTKDVLPSRLERNLDHFYTLNPDSDEYTFHSLHIDDYITNKLNTDFKFEIDKYLGISYDLDYFNYLFSKKTHFDKGEISKNTQKFSYFQDGDRNTPNTTLFRGLKFKISEVENINISEGRIEKVNLRNSNKFDGWKFSMIVSNNEYIITSSASDINSIDLIKSENVLKWRIIDQWKHEKDYNANSLVIYNNILYVNSIHSIIFDPNENPSNSTDWSPYQKQTIFYSPFFSGLATSNNLAQSFPGLPPLVYNSGEYYYSDGTSIWDFWSYNTTYSKDDLVTYNGKYWTSLVDDNTTIPNKESGFFTFSVFQYYWKESKDLVTRWNKVEVWQSDKVYENSWNLNLYRPGNYVYYDGTVYASTFSSQPPTIGTPPNLETKWSRIYSFVPDTEFQYGPSLAGNSILEINDRFYECVSNDLPLSQTNGVFYNSTLDNGIYVIINEKFKNILINIYVNDNTYTESVDNRGTWNLSKNYLKNTNRDDIYTTIFSKLTANNIMNCLNDLSNYFGFSDLIKYIIIREDSTINFYDFNNLDSISNLPYLISCEGPDSLRVKIRSNIVQPINLKPSEIKSKKILDESRIENIDEINFYNEMHLATSISQNKSGLVINPKYEMSKNEYFQKIYRYSGFYSPIFKNIELFQSPTIDKSETNYKFDTTLTHFGLVRQRIISKVNRKSNILTLKNEPNLKSIYPMIDEFGYHTVNFFIFKSTWDYEYHFECVTNDIDITPNSYNQKTFDTNSVDFRNLNPKLL